MSVLINETPIEILNDDIDEGIYSLTLDSKQVLRASAPIPPLETAEFLLTVYMYNMGTLYHFVDQPSFVSKMRLYYENGSHEFCGSLWFTQFLLVIAFGKLFLSQVASKEGPPGVAYFVQATLTMPGPLEISTFYNDPILGIEVLCLAALYLHSANKRNEAYIYVCIETHLRCE